MKQVVKEDAHCLEYIQQERGIVQTEKGKTMSDYIKREDAIKIINSGISIDTDADRRYVNGLFRAIRPADVAPVRHGYWLPMVAENKMTKDIRGARACSECGASYFSYYDVPDIEDVVPNYCPNCGARMDEEVEE